MKNPTDGSTGRAPRLPSMANAGPVSSSVFRLARAHRTLAASLLRTIGLYPGQELLIMHLLDHDGLVQSELVRLIGFDASTATKMLQRLESEGLLIRKQSPRDRRAMTVHLTATGKKLRKPLTEMWQELEVRCASSLSESDKKAAVHVLESIARSIETPE